ncbi:MAG TPA: type VI secretion protein ImpB [Thermopetrobacter sp.]|nr:type VI secretion protein ImpB [Thermopetrobacter sp.]
MWRESTMRDDAGPLRWLFLDFDSYFASVEQQERPDCRGRPLVVVPLEDTAATGAIAVSREAKRLGIRRGMRVAEMRRICPRLKIVAARHEVYVAWHHRLLAEVARHLPIDLVHSVDELSARLGRAQSHPGPARALARDIKDGIARNVGAALTCSIGLAPSRLLAKLAAEMDKPDGLRLLLPDDLPGAIAHLPLEEIPGVSTGILRRLAAAGVRDVPGLWRLAPRQARAIWGSVVGERFIRALHGEDVDPPPPGPPRSFGHGRVLAPEHRHPPAAWPVACALLLKAAARLRRARMAAGALTLSVRWLADPDGIAEEGAPAASVTGRSRRRVPRDMAWTARFPASGDSFVFLRRLEGLWTRLERAAARRADPRLRNVHVHLHALEPEHARQLDLFAATDARWRERERLWAEIDRLNRRFGARAVEPAGLKHLDLKYLGAKIAFGRIPEQGDF